MLQILIKKTFFTFWDHLGAIFLINLGYLVIAAFSFNIPKPSGPAGIAVVFIKFIAFFIYTGAVNGTVIKITDYSRTTIFDLLPNLKASWRSSLLFALFLLGLILMFSFFINYLTSFAEPIGRIGFGLFFLVIAASIMSFPYFFAFAARNNGSFLPSFKKCAWMFLNNIAYSFGLLLGSVLILVVSLFFFLMVPGIGLLLLWYNIAVGLRLKKYDYLEQNPAFKDRKIPWNTILKDDIEVLKTRSLKGLIFPWRQ